MCHFLYLHVLCLSIFSHINPFLPSKDNYIMSNTLNCNDDTHKYCDEGSSGASNKEMSTSCEQNKYVSESESNTNTGTNTNAAVYR